MQFSKAQAALSDEDIAAVETSIGLKLPPVLRAQYRLSNGGIPEPYVYEDENLDTVVTLFLPLTGPKATGTSAGCYCNLVLLKQIVPPRFFPFAVDGGGDYFFVDTQSSDGRVYFYRHDTAWEDERLLDLNVGIDAFWSKLKPE